MSRIVAVATTASEAVVTTGPVLSVSTILALGGIVLALAAFRVVSTLATMLSAAVESVSAIFAVLGRWFGVGLLGALVAVFALFGGSAADPDEPPPPAPAAVSTPH